MKKTWKLIAALVLSVMVFASCVDNPTPVIETGLDGQYMPKRKIATITYGDINSDPSSYSKEDFAWSGGLLAAIVHSDAKGQTSTTTYVYDTLKRVVEIKDTNPNSVTITYQFVYEDKDLVRVNRLNAINQPTDEYLFKKTDGKITEITHNQLASGSQTNVMTITYSGKNVKKTEVITSNGSYITATSTYDTKVNPLAGLFNTDFFNSMETVLSSNNLLTQNTNMPILGSVTTTNTIEYDGNDPVKVTSETKTLLSTETKVTNITYMK